MPFTVSLTYDALRDVNELEEYIAEFDSPSKADRVRERIASALESLSDTPERGAYVRELRALGVREFREIFFKPYRIIYYVDGKRVNVILVADGRRNMQALLYQRLINM